MSAKPALQVIVDHATGSVSIDGHVIALGISEFDIVGTSVSIPIQAESFTVLGSTREQEG